MKIRTFENVAQDGKMMSWYEPENKAQVIKYSPMGSQEGYILTFSDIEIADERIAENIRSARVFLLWAGKEMQGEVSHKSYSAFLEWLPT